MQKTFTLFLLLFCFLGLDAQYLPIAEADREFYVLYKWYPMSFAPTRTIIESIGEDSNGQKFLLKQDSLGASLDTLGSIQEDPQAGTMSVHFRENTHYAMSKDSVMLDFSLSKGDSFRYEDMPGGSYSLVVDTTYQMTDFRGIDRKVLEIVPQSTPLCYGVRIKLIEGIGSLSGFANPFPVCSATDVGVGQLKCAFDGDGTKFYGDTVANCFVMSTPRELAYSKMEVYPNPATNQLRWRHELELTSLEIHSMDGQLIRVYANPVESVGISQLPEGMYIVLMEDLEGERFKAKLLKE